MKYLKLIKGRSYFDGEIRATEKDPVIGVRDEKAKSLLGTGFFAEAEKPKKETRKTAVPKTESPLPYEPVEKPTAESQLKEELNAMTMAELTEYAQARGIKLMASKKYGMIQELLKADAKAQEARESLRSE